MYGYIYKTINIITNQIYIGKKKLNKLTGMKIFILDEGVETNY